MVLDDAGRDLDLGGGGANPVPAQSLGSAEEKLSVRAPVIRVVPRGDEVVRASVRSAFRKNPVFRLGLSGPRA